MRSLAERIKRLEAKSGPDSLYVKDLKVQLSSLNKRPKKGQQNEETYFTGVLPAKK